MLAGNICPSFLQLSQPNNNHKHFNKTTKTVVGFRLSNRWEPPTTTTTHHHRNSKLYDRAGIELNSENKSYQSILGDPNTVFEPYPNPKIAHQSPKKSNMTPRFSQNQKSELKALQKMKVFLLHEQTPKQFLNTTLIPKMLIRVPKSQK